MDGKSLSGGAAPLLVRTQGSDRSLPAGPSYLIGRDPECDIVIADIRVSWHHAVLGLENSTSLVKLKNPPACLRVPFASSYLRRVITNG